MSPKGGSRPFTPSKLNLRFPVPSDIENRTGSQTKAYLGDCGGSWPAAEELEMHGEYKAKWRLSVLERLKDVPDGKYIEVTAITPTPLRRGQEHDHDGPEPGTGAFLGKKVFTCIRQPSQGPTFGIKGGAGWRWV